MSSFGCHKCEQRVSVLVAELRSLKNRPKANDPMMG